MKTRETVARNMSAGVINVKTESAWMLYLQSVSQICHSRLPRYLLITPWVLCKIHFSTLKVFNYLITQSRCNTDRKVNFICHTAYIQKTWKIPPTSYQGPGNFWHLMILAMFLICIGMSSENIILASTILKYYSSPSQSSSCSKIFFKGQGIL